MLVVTQSGRDTLGFVDPEQGKVVDAIRVGDEPAHVIVDQSRSRAFVAVSGENAVVEVDLVARDVVNRVEVGRDPRAMVWDAEAQRLYVASLMSSNAHPQGRLQQQWVPPEQERDVAVLETTDGLALLTWSQPAGTLLRGLELVGQDRLLVAQTEARNTQSRIEADVRAHIGTLTVLRRTPDASGRLPVVETINLDEQPSSSGMAASPFSVKATPDGRRVLVTQAAGRGVLVLDGETFAEVGRLEAGLDTRGLLFAQGRVWTYGWLDNVVQGWTIPTPERDLEQVRQSRTEVVVGNDPTPEDIKLGQRFFNDAGFSRHGDFSCGNCHIEGLTDGLVWDLLLDGDVNTQPFRNIGGTDPFLWGGFLPTLFDFSREVLRLVGANATGEQMELMTRYMQSVTAPPNPYTLPGGRFTEAALRGRQIFERPATELGGAGCASCHSGPLLTGRFVVQGKTPGLPTDVPSLIGVYDTGPWGRQAQWNTLEEMVAFAVEFTRGQLTPQQLDDLNAYVRQLPGDRMFLNSS
ncbi:MAG: cytochrome c peroxidase, partial [Myxococcota bacterium]